jgi:hypothetical protein
VERRCHHHPFDEKDAAIIAILGSRDCLDRYLRRESASSYLN